ncbi:MAG: ABC transporter permease, partial [Clostridia bacterium]|nr:ABC transporter permease [Clostridia bacterium]
ALTMLGIVIGIAAIIAIVSLINGVSEQMKSEYIGTTSTIDLKPYAAQSTMDFWSMEYSVSDYGTVEGVNVISDDALKQVQRVNGIGSAARAYVNMYSSLIYQGHSINIFTYGVDADYFEASSYHVVSGRLITENDVKNSNNVVVIDNQCATVMFNNNNPIGKTVQIDSDLFTVVGVVMKPIDERKINSINDLQTQIGMQSSIFVPMSAWPNLQGYDDIQILSLKISDPDLTVAATTEAGEILDSYIDTTMVTYKSSMLEEMSNYLNQTVSMMSLLLGGIASISLIVGGIGIMNIMLVSVTERTREIGLKKALGAKRRVILGQFLTESAVLSALGGLIGVLLGIGIAKVISIFAYIPAPISVSSIVISVSFSMCIGIIFGLVPSIKASRLDPIEALRYE